MTVSYQRAGDDVIRLVQEIRREYHKFLEGNEVTVDVLMVEDIDEESGEVVPTLKHNGYAAAATIQIVQAKHRALGIADALMTIDGYAWGNSSEAEKRALIDHELEHLDLVLDKNGDPKKDDMGRQKLKLRLHDWQLGGFDAVARRHGKNAIEVQSVHAVVDERGQCRWNFDDSDDGIVMTIKTGGTSNKVVTLDGAAQKRLKAVAASV